MPKHIDSYIGKYKVRALLEIIKLTESGETIFDLDAHIFGCNVNM